MCESRSRGECGRTSAKGGGGPSRREFPIPLLFRLSFRLDQLPRANLSLLLPHLSSSFSSNSVPYLVQRRVRFQSLFFALLCFGVFCPLSFFIIRLLLHIPGFILGILCNLFSSLLSPPRSHSHSRAQRVFSLPLSSSLTLFSQPSLSLFHPPSRQSVNAWFLCRNRITRSIDRSQV